MARPKNDMLKEQIAKVAAQQFALYGYDATSYASIADACGISKNLVQYHWPKKVLLAVKYMEEILSNCVAELGFQDSDLFDDYERMALVGTRFFETLLASEGTRIFLKDIIVDRGLTESVLAFNFQWATSRVNHAHYDVDKAQRTVIVSMGGFYDLLYWCLKYDKPIDVEPEIRRVVDAFRKAVL